MRKMTEGIWLKERKVRADAVGNNIEADDRLIPS